MTAVARRATHWALIVGGLAAAWTAGRMSARDAAEQQPRRPAPAAPVVPARTDARLHSGPEGVAPPPAASEEADTPVPRARTVRERLVAGAAREPEYGDAVVRALAREAQESAVAREDLLRLLREETDAAVLDWLGRVLILPALGHVSDDERGELLRLLRESEPRARRIAAGQAWMRAALDAQEPGLRSQIRDLLDGGVPLDSVEPVLTVATELRYTRLPEIRDALERAAARARGPEMRPLLEAVLRGMPGDRAFDWGWERWCRAASDDERSVVAVALADFLPGGLGLRRIGMGSAEPDHARIDRYLDIFSGTRSMNVRERLAARLPVLFGLTGTRWAATMRRLAAMEPDPALRDRILGLADAVEAGTVRDSGVAARLLAAQR